MARNPVVLMHGYSDQGASFGAWRGALERAGYTTEELPTCNYLTLTNEVTIKDIAEGFDRALALRSGLDADQPFDAIVHSTGMLVIRSWLTAYPERRGRLKRLIGLAPASFGSPLAHKGRSWLGAIFKGNKDVDSPDFLEAGDLVLDALELGSRFTWELAHKDLLGETPFYGPDRDTPYVLIFCGTSSYGGIRKLISELGADGTVRWAGCPLNTRKITVDLSKSGGDPAVRATFDKWSNEDIPLYPIAGKTHGTILSDPGDELIELVTTALSVESKDDLEAWRRTAQEITEPGRDALHDQQWQQFVVRATDERGDPVPDYNLQLFTSVEGDWREVEEFDLDVHAYSSDQSFRCFHVNLSKLRPEALSNLKLKIMCSSGTQLVAYCGSLPADATRFDEGGWWEGWLDLSGLLTAAGPKIFYPFTTTLVEIRLNREPLPLDRRRESKVLGFLDGSSPV